MRHLALVALMLFVPAISQAATIFESATLGPIGRGTQGPIVGGGQSLGVRFEVDETVFTGEVGGHFASFATPGLPIFGAIIALTDSADFPDSVDYSSADVLGVALFTPTFGSSEVTCLKVTRSFSTTTASI